MASAGRLLAGFPVGMSTDANRVYGDISGPRRERHAESNASVKQLNSNISAGSRLDNHSASGLSAELPIELPELLFHEPAKYTALPAGGDDLNDPAFLTEFLVANAGRMWNSRNDPIFDSRSWPRRTAASHSRADAGELGRLVRADSARVREALGRRHYRCDPNGDRRRGARGGLRTDGHRTGRNPEAAQLTGCRNAWPPI